jgi:signal peptidase II
MSTRAVAFGIAALVFAADRFTKRLIESNVSPWDTIVVIPHFFNIIHTKNRGAAFGIMAESTGELRTFVLIGLSSIVLVFVAALLWQASGFGSRESRMMRIALALILGGAAGNIYDRILSGMVTDFLDFYIGSWHWHTFNVGDSAITVGAALVLLDMLRARSRRAAADAGRI